MLALWIGRDHLVLIFGSLDQAKEQKKNIFIKAAELIQKYKSDYLYVTYIKTYSIKINYDG